MDGNKVAWERPAKEDLFLLLACLSSLPSPDAQTQCGCLITTLDNRVLGTGYNGFPRGCNNDRLPNTRPDKYPWVSAGHSERNAVNNCVVSPRATGGIAYASCNCCFDCTCHLWNNGVEKIYEVVGFSNPVMCQTSKDEELKRQLQYELMLEGKTLEIIKVTKESIGKIFHREQLVKILTLFAQTGFDYELIDDFAKRIFA